MQTSKRSGKNILARIACFIAGFILLERLAAFAVVPANSYTRLTMHEFYNQTENIDYAFIGASTTYRFFNPKKFDEASGKNTFNLGSSAQSLTTTYYTLKEVFNHYHPQKVFIGQVPEHCLDSETEVEDTTFQDTLMFHHFKPSPNKLAYWNEAFKGYSRIYAISPGLTYLNQNLAPRMFLRMPSNIKSKLSVKYRSYSYEIAKNPTERYDGKGFVYNENIGELSPFKSEWRPEAIDKNKIMYLRKIAELCAENGAKLFFVLTPRPVRSICGYADYDDVHAYYQALCDEMDAVFLDCNLMRRQIFYRPDELFYDMSHIRGAGAETFSSILAEIVNMYDEKTLDMGHYFYSSAEEMKADTQL
jgi:hypothetical protein